MFPLTPAAWLSAPPLFAKPLDAGTWLNLTNTTLPEAHGPHKDNRLGRQFEDMVMAQVAADPDLSIAVRNLAIRAAGRTLGELDAIIYHRPSQQWWHWELTFKHYLGVASEFWPGSNPRDHFHRKYQHGLQHQFPLAYHPLSLPLLPGPITAQHLFSRGILYYPGHYSLMPPTGAHPQHLRGVWWPAEQLPHRQKYLVVPKQHWLNAQVLFEQQPAWHSAGAIIQHVHAVNCPLLVLTPQAPGSYSPTFVVPNNWISHAQNEYSEKAGQ